MKIGFGSVLFMAVLNVAIGVVGMTDVLPCTGIVFALVCIAAIINECHADGPQPGDEFIE